VTARQDQPLHLVVGVMNPRVETRVNPPAPSSALLSQSLRAATKQIGAPSWILKDSSVLGVPGSHRGYLLSRASPGTDPMPLHRSIVKRETPALTSSPANSKSPLSLRPTNILPSQNRRGATVVAADANALLFSSRSRFQLKTSFKNAASSSTTTRAGNGRSTRRTTLGGSSNVSPMAVSTSLGTICTLPR
jgi:hypothetical protein